MVLREPGGRSTILSPGDLERSLGVRYSISTLCAGAQTGGSGCPETGVVDFQTEDTLFFGSLLFCFSGPTFPPQSCCSRAKGRGPGTQSSELPWLLPLRSTHSFLKMETSQVRKKTGCRVSSCSKLQL